MPGISVILPVYNGIDYLDKSVTSVLQQEYKDFELLIIDDCSADESWAYLQSLKDERIKLYKNEKNSGLFFNLNFLIKNSNSPLVKLWAQDDIMYSHCLGAIVAFHSKHPGIGFSYCGFNIINENGELQKHPGVDQTPEIITPPLHARIAFFTGSISDNIANVCLNRNALNTVGLFKEPMKISADFDMWVRLAKDHNIGRIHDKLIKLRNHPAQLSRKETYYIYHIREDLKVYRYLLNYVEPAIKKYGRFLLRNYKLVFYYTLMVKAIMKGNLKTAYLFYKELSAFDNFFILTVCFIKNKLNKPSQPELLKW